jgi:hypothetical protein
MAFLGMASCVFAQGTGPPPVADPAAANSQDEIPDAPVPHPTDEDLSAGAPLPQIEVALAADPQTPDPQSGQTQNPSPPAAGTAPPPAASGIATQSSSSQQNSSQQPDTEETKHQKAEQEVKEQEHQRMAGIIPEYNVSYRGDAVPLTTAEKFELEFRSATDPYTFTVAIIVAGFGEADDSDAGFGWGPLGFTKRAAASYADNVIGNTLGNAVLPSILHQDPRYFRLGHGTIRHRFFYAVATAFICRHDTTRKWEPNYSNVLGNMIAGEISNLYYPGETMGGIGHAIDTGLTVTFEGTFGSTLEEFWPDISRKLFHKDPTHGLDAQAQAQDAAQKQEKQQDENQKNQQ